MARATAGATALTAVPTNATKTALQGGHEAATATGYEACGTPRPATAGRTAAICMAPQTHGEGSEGREHTTAAA